MNDDRHFERFVADNLGDMGGLPLPDTFYEDVLEHTRSHRQPPRWLALVRERPMRVSSVVAVGSPGIQRAATLVATLLLTLVVAGAGIAGTRLLGTGKTIVVDPSGAGDTTTIAQAVAMAEDGDTVLVTPGTYTGSVVIDKDITVRGEDRDGVVIDVRCSVVEDAAGHRSIDGGPDALAGSRPKNVELLYWGVSSVQVSACPEGTSTFTRPYWDGSIPYGLLIDSPDAKVSDLTLAGADAAIVVTGGAPRIEDVTATGVLIVEGSRATLSRSEVIRVEVGERSAVTIDDNDIVFLTVNFTQPPYGGPSEVRDNRLAGLWFLGDVTVEGNTFRLPDPSYGAFVPTAIQIQTTPGWVVRNNDISGYDTAIRQWDRMDTGLIEGNTITDNFNGIVGPTRGTNEPGEPGTVIVKDNVLRGMRSAAIDGFEPAALILDGNTIEDNKIGVQYRREVPTMSGNRICGNETNVRPLRGAPRPDATTNDICPDEPA